MGKLQYHWWNLFIWTLVYLASCAPSCNYLNFPLTGQVCEGKLNKNFSLGPRADTLNDGFLYYEIKNQNGWIEYNRTLKRLVPCPYRDCEPSQLQSLRLTKNQLVINPGTIEKKIYQWSAIQINFTIPKPTKDLNYFTGAIKLTLSSDWNSTKGDPSFEEKHRLFEFSTYRYTSIDNDETKRRILRFPCFVGFHYEPCQTDDYKVYSITLTSFSRGMKNRNLTVYTELTYNITVYGYHAYHINPSVWKSTIAIALYPGKKDVTIVFDPVPDSLSVSKYNVSLVDVYTNATRRNQIVNHGTPNNLCFKNTEDGVYYISITTLCDDSNCLLNGQKTRSHVFIVGNTQLISTTVLSEEWDTFLHVYLSVGTGVCLALTLLGVLCYYRWRNHTTPGKSELHSLPKVLLIYSNIDEMNSVLAESVAIICNKSMHIKVVYDKLEPETTRIKQRGYSSWYRDKLDESSASVILWTPGSDVRPEDKERTYNAFNNAVTMALNSTTNDDKKLFCVYFDKTHKETIPIDLQREAEIFRLFEESSQLISVLCKHTLRSVHLESSFSGEHLAPQEDNNIITVFSDTNRQGDLEDGTLTSIPENINPYCPLHGDRKGNVPAKPSISKQRYRSSVSRVPVRTDIPYVPHHSNPEEYPSCCDDGGFSPCRFHSMQNSLRNKILHLSPCDRLFEFPKNCESCPSRRLEKSYSYDKDGTHVFPRNNEFLHPGTLIGLDVGNRLTDDFLSDEDNEETRLMLPVSCRSDQSHRVPLYTQVKMFPRAHSVGSVESTYSSDSIDSLELKDSFRNFI